MAGNSSRGNYLIVAEIRRTVLIVPLSQYRCADASGGAAQEATDAVAVNGKLDKGTLKASSDRD